MSKRPTIADNGLWTKSGTGLYRYNPSGKYHARVRHGGKLHRQSLKTTDFAYAKRLLAQFKADIGRTDPHSGNTTFGAVLDKYAETLGQLKPSTRKNKLRIVAVLKRTWYGASRMPVRVVKTSDLKAWLSKHRTGSASTYNQAVTVLRDALQLAVEDRVIADSPAANIKYHKPDAPLRSTPTFEEFNSIVADIRSQKFNGHGAQASADFIEFMGLAGLGQAEARSLKRRDIDLKKGTITTFRHKTATGFQIPVYPQLRPLLERLCKDKRHDEHLLTISNAKKAVEAACERLGLPRYTQRSLRRMFVTKAIENGVDVKVIAQWQGHKDGGALLLRTYSHVRPVHSQRMAELMK
jgi:integrase